MINKKKTKPDLKQVIETIVNPFGVIAISKSIITKLNNNGALTDVLDEIITLIRGKLRQHQL